MVTEPHCEHCSATSVDLKTCSRCKRAMYCSEAHQRADWPCHKPHCFSPTDEAEISIYALRYMDKYDNADPELSKLCAQERKGIRDFLLSHPFPSKERILRYVREEGQSIQFIRGGERYLNYPLAKRLWEAGAIESHLEKFKEIRRVGMLISKSTGGKAKSMEQMRFHFYLIQQIICGPAIFSDERETYGLPVAPVFSYHSNIEHIWDGVGPWQR